MIKRYHVFGDVSESPVGDYVSYDDYEDAEKARQMLLKHFNLSECRGEHYNLFYLVSILME